MEHKIPKPDMTGLTDAEAYAACCNWAVEEGYRQHWLMTHLHMPDYISRCVAGYETDWMSEKCKANGIPEGGIFYSKEDSNLAVYCQSPEKARRCVYTQIKPGRLLAKLGRSQAEIEEALAMYGENQYTLEIVSDPKKIAKIYQEASISSCMRFGCPPDPHPCEAYGGTHPKRCDLYIVRNKSGKVVARSMFPVETGLPIRWYIGDNVSAVKAFLHFKGIEKEHRSQQGYYIRKLSDWYGPYLDTYVSDRKPTGGKDSEGYEMYEICDWDKGRQVHCSHCSMYGAQFDYGDHDCAEDTVECSDCGCSLSEDDALYDEDGDAYCRGCYYDRYFSCDRCGCESNCNESYQLLSGDLYCENCYERYAGECAECGEAFRSGDLYELNGKSYCDECFDQLTVPCTGCGDRIIEYATVANNPYCEKCFEIHFNVCPTCSKVEERPNPATLGKRSCHTHCQTCSAHVYFSPRIDSGLIDLPVVHV